MRSFVLSVSLLALPVALVAQSGRGESGTDFVVTTQWLAEHQGDRDVVLIHVVRDSSYRDEQIPGTRQIYYRDFVAMRDSVGTELPSVEALRATMERLGIRNRSHVVVYAAEAPAATRFLFTLDYLGHRKMSFLDGGLRKWKREGREVTLTRVPVVASKYSPHPRRELIASADWVNERLEKPGLSLIDTRTMPEYLGVGTTSNLPSTGHLAGAQLLPWEQMFSDADHSELRSREDLRRMYGERVRPGDQVVTYCWVGYRGSATYFIARYLGYDVKLFDGSFQEWSQRKLPVRAGATP